MHVGGCHDGTRRRRRGGIRAAIVVTLVLLLGAGFVVVVAVLPAPATKLPSKRLAPVNVTAPPIEPIRNYRDTFKLPGSVEPNRVVRVAAEVAGRVESIPCREGQPCRTGEKLVLLNTDLLQAEYDQAKASMQFDAREASRMEELVGRGAATTNELDQARTKAASSQAALAAAKARLDRAVISAPIPGVLNRLPVEVGEYVSPGDAVAEIVDIDTAVVVADVPERDIHHLKVGQSEEVLVDPLAGTRVVGTIRYINEVADPRSRTTRVEIEVDNRRRLLRSGQIVTVVLLRRVLDRVIMIPLDAVIPLEKEYRAYVVEDGKAQPRTVKLGFLKGRSVSVLSGLDAGDRLIVKGLQYVGPGQPVALHPANDPAATSPASAPGDAGPGAQQ
ncbi:MAG: efflux RND transporter periplasmic adaptor subunit [Phycisphaerae bacterium]